MEGRHRGDVRQGYTSSGLPVAETARAIKRHTLHTILNPREGEGVGGARAGMPMVDDPEIEEQIGRHLTGLMRHHLASGMARGGGQIPIEEAHQRDLQIIRERLGSGAGRSIQLGDEVIRPIGGRLQVGLMAVRQGARERAEEILRIGSTPQGRGIPPPPIPEPLRVGHFTGFESPEEDEPLFAEPDTTDDEEDIFGADIGAERGTPPEPAPPPEGIPD